VTIYDDARTAITKVDAANQDLAQLATGNPELAMLGPDIDGVSGHVKAMNSLINKAAALSPMPPVGGLFVEGASSPVPQVTNVMANAGWKDLQASPGAGITAGNPIDKMLAKRPNGDFHVRLYFGRRSPDWALNLGWVDTHDAYDNVDARSPRWWEADVQQAQLDFLTRLAVKYDGKVALIFMATPMTVYAEPFIRGISDATTRKNLLAAGYTREKDMAAFDFMLKAFDVFKKTRLGLAFNPFQYVKPDGTGAQDVNFTNSFMDKMRTAFGPRAHVQNNSIRTPTLGKPGSSYGQMYDHMKGLKPSGYQTATEPRVGDYAKTIEWAIAQGAQSVELSPGFHNHLTAAQLLKYDQALKANAV